MNPPIRIPLVGRRVGHTVLLTGRTEDMRRTIRTAAAAWAVALTLLLSQAIPAQASVLIKAGGNAACNRFRPASASIAKGTTIVWKSTCGTHTVTAYGGNWSKNTTINQGQSTSRVFKARGVFKFRCTFHSHKDSTGHWVGMIGKIVVGA
jgi:plastocyanin